jgi:pimeloyl-ACP methyl ester carboxylesterase
LGDVQGHSDRENQVLVGSGATTMVALVILPGLDGTAALHSHFSEAASGFFESVKVIAYPPDKPLGYAALEELVRANLPPKPFVLLGESFSGPIALSIAAKPPSNLLGIVLSATFARPAIPALSPFSSIIRFLPARAVPLSFFSWLLLGQWTTEALKKSLKDALGMVAPDVLAFRTMAALNPPKVNLTAIALPTLYLRARKDRLIGPSAGEYIRLAMSHCNLREVDGPHLLLQAASETCAQIIGEFVRPFDVIP